MSKIIAPAVIRGQIITDSLVSFGGRDGVTEFLSPDPLSIVDRLPLRNSGEMRDLYTLSIEDIIDYIVELGDFLDIEKNEHMQESLELSYAVTDMTPPVLRWQYDIVKPYLSREMVREAIDLPVGIPYVEGWQKHILSDGRIGSVRAMGARALHIIAGNSPMVAVLTVMRNALTRSDAIVKLPSNDPFTGLAVARSMVAMAPDHPVTKHLAVAYWKGGSEAFEQKLYQPHNIEKIIAWGGFASVKHVTRYVQPGLELISLDPKRSATIIGKQAFASEAAMQDVAVRLAADIGTLNQLACLSARVVLIESGTDDEGIERLTKLGRMVYDAVQSLPTPISTKAKYFDPELRSEIQALRPQRDFYTVIGGQNDEGAIIVSHQDEVVDFYTSLSGRVANFVPLDDVRDSVKFMNSYTQTIGIYPEALKEELRDELPLWGAQRLVTLGYAVTQNSGLPQDAIEPVRRMVKWITDETCEVETMPPLWLMEEPGSEAA
jgi:hypothetical protein